MHLRKTITPVLKSCLILGKNYLYPKTRLQKTATGVTAFLCVAGFIAFILAAISYKYGGLPDFIGTGLFSTYDGGLVEVVGYIMVSLSIILLGNVMTSQKQYQWAPFIVFLLLVLTDDVYQLHEIIGYHFEATYGLENYITDALGFACLGIVGSVAWITGLCISKKNAVDFENYLVFSAYLGFLIVVGVVFDAFDSYVITHYNISQTFLGVIEEGSEMIFMCLMALTALGFHQSIALQQD